jgi:hypothetical protein
LRQEPSRFKRHLPFTEWNPQMLDATDARARSPRVLKSNSLADLGEETAALIEGARPRPEIVGRPGTLAGARPDEGYWQEEGGQSCSRDRARPDGGVLRMDWTLKAGLGLDMIFSHDTLWT